MDHFSFEHLSDSSLVVSTRSLRRGRRLSEAVEVARIAEIDRRRIGEREGYRSTTAWCIVELEHSEDEASRRCRAARFGRRFPVLFEAMADGRLTLSAVNLIGPHLTEATVDEWVALAAHKTNAAIRELIALRHPRPDAPDGIVALPDRVVEELGDRVMPTAPQRYLFQCAGGEALREMLEEARNLMSHQNPGGAIEPVLLEALELLIPALRKQKFAASGTKGTPRYISSEVKAQVWARDGGACAFVGESGRRCGSRWHVQFDHIEPVACGGEATVDNVRCLCQAHNQLVAERRFGAEFMAEKRREAAEARQASRIEARSRAGAEWPAPAADFHAEAELDASDATDFRAGAEMGPSDATDFRAGAETGSGTTTQFRAGAELVRPRTGEVTSPAAA